MGRLRRASGVPYEPYSVALRRLLSDLRKDRAAFLVGAGVSMLEPSNLPSGNALKDACVEALRAAEPGLPAYVTLLRRDKRYWRVVPELVFQKFFEVLLGRFHHYFIHLGLSDPNQGHGVLGTVAAGGIPVLTTNFDDLIERAASITRGVLHLHGHLGKPPEMVVRINQVGRGLSRQLRAAMLKAIECRTVYVLGYSGADPEIMGALAAASLHRVVWFARPPVEPAVRQNVGRLALHHDCTVVVADLRRLFTDVGRQYSVIPPKRPDRRRERVRHVKDWALKLTSAERWACVGDVFTLLERYEQARDVYLEGMRFADCRFPKAWFLNEAADCMKTAGRFVDARRYAQQALRVNRGPIDWAAKAGSLNLLGLVQLEKARPEPKRARPYFLRAVRTLKRYLPTHTARVSKDGKEGFIGRIYNNLGLAGLAARNPREALRYCQKSLAIKRRRGDLIGTCLTSMNACIAAYEARDFRRASRWKRAALAIATRYDRAFEQAYLFRELGRINCEQGRQKHGLTLLKRARTIYAGNATLQFGLKMTERMIRRFSPKS